MQPFARVVHGVPVLWDSNTVSARFQFGIWLAVWSPCNRFIAISSPHTMGVYTLDSATLQQLQSLKFPQETPISFEAIVFSPDSRMLTSLRNNSLDGGWFLVSWDLQTGGVVSVIQWEGPCDTEVWNVQITYSMNGSMVAVLSRYQSSTIISICDVVSGVYMHAVEHSTHTSLDLNLMGTPYVYKIWTHGESLQFATAELTGITIWEVGFAPGATPAKVEVVSIPDKTVETCVFKPMEQDDIAWTEFHPASCRLAFIGTGGALLVWDARASKFLLHHTGVSFLSSMSFSSDGHFFACTTVKSEVYLWRESPTGYTLFERISTPCSKLCFSPDGESTITFCGSKIQLWHVKGFTTTTSSLAQALQHTSEDFVLEFLPDRLLAVVAQKKNKTVAVLNLTSGALQLTIDTSIEVYGLRLIKNAIAVVGSEKAILWNIPEGNYLPGARMNVGDNTQIINLDNMDHHIVFAASISLNFQYIALAKYDIGEGFVDVYHTSTGWKLHGQTEAISLWFAPDRHEVWCAAARGAEVFSITQEALIHTNSIADIEDAQLGCPWGSPHGYKVTIDGWIFSANGKQLLMLPPIWQSRFKVYRVWNGRFLALLHGGLPEVVVLELEP